MLNLLLAFLAALLFGWFVSLPVIWILKVFRIGQYIRQEGPLSHRTKAGTPTMGGIACFITILIFTLVLINVDLSLKHMALLGLFLGFALLGLIDDHLKVKHRENKGIAPRHKLCGQLIIASLFSGALIWLGHASGVGGFLKYFYLDIPALYFPFMVLVIVGTSNAVNLTDGLDGLAAGLLCIAFVAFALIAFSLQMFDEALIAAVAGGAVLSFLWFNFHPADVFMGDIGSLSLGALLSGIAILIHKEVLLLFIGGVFVIETLSVVLQVACFKAFRLRLFRMSPIHHHFELLGFSEAAVVLAFYAFGLLLAVCGVLLSFYF